MDLNKSSNQILVDMINLANEGSEFDESDLSFGTPEPFIDAQNPDTGNDTQIEVTIVAENKTKTVYYRRIPLNLIYAAPVELRYADEVTELQLVQRTNALGERPIRLGGDDIINPGFAPPTQFPTSVQIRANPGSLMYSGVFTVVLTDPARVPVDPTADPVVTIGGAVAVKEGGALDFVVQTNKQLLRAIQVGVVYSGSAKAAGPSSVTIGEGLMAAALRVPVPDDGEAAGLTKVTATLQPGAGYTLGAAKAASGNVIDSGFVAPVPERPRPQISIADAAAVTEGGPMVFTVSSNIALDAVLTIPLAYAGTATDGVDYVGPSSVTIAQGATTATIELAIDDDGVAEGNETVQITLQPGVGYDLVDAVAVGSIIDTGWANVGLSLASGGNITEGGKAVFNVALSVAAPQALTVPLTWSGTFNGTTATKPASLSIAKGATSAKVELQTTDELEAARSGTLILTLGTGTGYTLDVASATVTVAATNAISLSVADPANVNEGNNFNFVVSLSAPARSAFTLNLSYGGSLPSSEYTAPASVQVPANATSVNIPVTTLNDNVADGNQTLSVTLQKPTGYVLARATGTATIVDAGVASVNASLADSANVNEGSSVSFVLTLASAAAADAVFSVAYGGTLAAGQRSGPATLTVPAGATTATLTVATTSNKQADGNKTLTATLTAPSGYTLTRATASATIVDAGIPNIALSVADGATTEEGNAVKFNITLSEPALQVMTVPLTYGGTYAGGKNGPASVTIAKDATGPIEVSVPTTVDTDLNGGTLTITLGNGTGYTLTRATATATITDNSGGTPTADGPMEAAISPAPTARRSNYQATKVDVIDPAPDWMTSGNGVYWGDQVTAPSPAYPDRRFNYYSTDHATGTGGIIVTVCVGDPSLKANWKSYDAAVDAGWLSDIPDLPAKGGPMFTGFGGPGFQYETPCVNKVGNEFVMTYQATNVPGARNQATLVAVSPNGISNWVGTHTPLMQVAASEAVGDGHHGYMKWGPNPFPRELVPYDYVGYSLVGGQSRSSQGMWGSNAPKTTWAFLGSVGKHSGRMTPSSRFNTNTDRYKLAMTAVDVKSFRKTRQGYAAMGEFAGVGSGATARPGELYEILFSADGKRVISRPILVVPRGAAGSYDEREVGTGSVLTFADKSIITYYSANSSNRKVAALAVSPLRNPDNAWFNMPSPAIPPASKITTRTYDFRGASALPAGLTTVVAGTTAPAPAFSADGMSVTVDGTMAEKGQIQFFDDLGFDPATTEYVEIYVEGWVTTSAAAYRHPYIGFTAEKTVRANFQDAFFIGTGEIADATLGYQAIIGGAQPVAAGSSEDYWGVGYGTSAFGTMSGSKKNVGVRYYPKDNVAYILGEGGVEQQEIKAGNSPMIANFTKAKPLFPFFGFLGTDTAAATERVAKVTVKVASMTKAAGAATMGPVSTVGYTTPVSNAPTAIPSLAIGTPAADRVVAFVVYGRNASDVTNVTANFTPTGGSAIALTQVRFFKVSYGSAPTTFVALLVAAIPTGTEGIITPTATASGTIARWGVKAMVMYGVKTLPDSVDAAGMNSWGNSYEVAVDKFESGITLVGTLHSTSGSTLHCHAMEEALFDSISQEIHVMPSSSGTVSYLGVRNGSASTQIQATSSATSVSIAASWKKAS